MCKKSESWHSLCHISIHFTHLKFWTASGPVFSCKLQYIVGFWSVQMAISTVQKPTIYCNLYEDTAPARHTFKWLKIPFFHSAVKVLIFVRISGVKIYYNYFDTVLAAESLSISDLLSRFFRVSQHLRARIEYLSFHHFYLKILLRGAESNVSCWLK